MLPIIEQKQLEIESLCRRFGVRRLEVFGSATNGRFDPARSDLDFLVEFQDPPPTGWADAYFGLLENFEDLFKRRIDLVVDSAITNPYFRQSIDKSRQLVYAA